MSGGQPGLLMILNQKLGQGKQILRFLKRNFIENHISVSRVVIFCISGFYSTVFSVLCVRKAREGYQFRELFSWSRRAARREQQEHCSSAR